MGKGDTGDVRQIALESHCRNDITRICSKLFGGESNTFRCSGTGRRHLQMRETLRNSSESQCRLARLQGANRYSFAAGSNNLEDELGIVTGRESDVFAGTIRFFSFRKEL